MTWDHRVDTVKTMDLCHINCPFMNDYLTCFVPLVKYCHLVEHTVVSGIHTSLLISYCHSAVTVRPTFPVNSIHFNCHFITVISQMPLLFIQCMSFCHTLSLLFLKCR